MASHIIRVGDVEVMALSDGMLEFDLCNFFPTIPGEEWAPYEAHLTGEHKVRFNLGSYLIRSSGRTILVDTGLGPRPADMPDAPWGRLLHDLRANGVSPDDVDMVVMTHLHRDHVGWNLGREGSRWVPTFPRARYWMSAGDWEACRQPDVQPQRYVNAPTCVWPLEELGLIELMHGEHGLTRELTAVPTPGHTPGHVSLLVTSRGQRALVLGDAAHSPVQPAGRGGRSSTAWSARRSSWRPGISRPPASAASCAWRAAGTREDSSASGRGLAPGPAPGARICARRPVSRRSVQRAAHPRGPDMEGPTVK